MSEFALSKLTPEKVRDAVVTPELMGAFMRKFAEQHGDGNGKPDPHLAAFLVLADATGRKPGAKSKPPSLKEYATLASLTKRGFALAELDRAGHLANWKLNKVDHSLLHPAVIHAAAITSLQGTGEEFRFEPMEFLMNALAAAPINEPFTRS